MTTVLDDLPKSDPKATISINVYCLNPLEWKDIRANLHLFFPQVVEYAI